MPTKPSIESRDGSAILRVRVQPKSSRNDLRLDSDGSIRVAVTAPPAGGQANRAVIALLARKLGVRKSAVTLSAGGKSRDKTVSISDMDVATLREKLFSAT